MLTMLNKNSNIFTPNTTAVKTNPPIVMNLEVEGGCHTLLMSTSRIDCYTKIEQGSIPYECADQGTTPTQMCNEVGLERPIHYSH